MAVRTQNLTSNSCSIGLGVFVAKVRTLCVLAILSFQLSGCYIYNFFFKDKSSGSQDQPTMAVGIGPRAGGQDNAALQEVYNTTSIHPPAAIRPDPDLVVRRLLLQFRPLSDTLARQVGRVEQYRMLLGGASEDFAKQPQDSYDATSLLATLQVAEEVCRGLVAPNRYEHDDWQTILPYAANRESDNILWLIQRLTGVPTAQITNAMVLDVIAIMDASEVMIMEQQWAQNNAYAKYVPACTAVIMDAEALYL